MSLLLCLQANGVEKEEISKLSTPSEVSEYRTPDKDLVLLMELLEKEKTPENFYKKANAWLDRLDKIAGEESMESNLGDRVWLLYMVAKAPLLEAKYNKKESYVYFADDIDLKARGKILQSVLNAPDRYVGETLLQQKQLRPLVAEYVAGLMKLFKELYDPEWEKKHEALLKNTPFERRKLPLPIAEDVAREKEESLNRQKEWEKKIDEAMSKGAIPENPPIRIGSTASGKAHIRFKQKMVFDKNRNDMAGNVIDEMEESFVKTMLQFFPASKVEAIKYFRLAGYSEEEIPRLLDKVK